MPINQLLVSILMNCYNSDTYLRQAIDSVYAQTYDNWEIVFWDNASIDQSAEIAKSYYDKVKYYKSNSISCLPWAKIYCTFSFLKN